MHRFNNQYQENLYLKDTAFQDLMQRRIFNVLLIATPYDAFTIEEDGRVEEQVYFEYVSLNLSSAPRFTKVSNYEEAYHRLREKTYDLVIAMPGADVSQTFQEAKNIKRFYPDMPFVVLTTFSREVRRRLENEDFSGVDYVFSWLGNVQLIVAIIKLLEDRMNAPIDISEVGVQAIMLIEDSIRFYSSLLPHLFNYLLNQSMIFSTEALNEHERMLRMRGRPKVLLARDYEEARKLYDLYGHQMLGIISDMRFPRGGVKGAQSGLEFAEYVRSQDPTLPIIFESSEQGNRQPVEDYGCRFLYKESKTLPQELREAVAHEFGFGDFTVLNPVTGQPIMTIHNLKELQKQIFNIPSDSLYHHCSHNDISRWLYSRALFPIASTLASIKFTDMSQTPAVRKLVFDCIVKYRRMKNRGVVAIFKKDRFDRYSNFARIGEGSLGGKGRGLAFIDQIIKKNPICDDFKGVQVQIPRTVVLCTDIFDEFMETNRLYPVALSDRPDQEILDAFLNAKLPKSVLEDLEALFEVVDKPLAVRSSSLLEDSHYQPFAGVYSTYMVPHLEDGKKMLRLVTDAIKGVYASVFFADSKAYMNATSNIIDQEKMAVILQEVVGERHGDYYYPTFSGVARSINYYPTGDEVAEDGVAEVAVGLGKYIVDGGMALRFSPKHPHKVLQTSTLDLALRDTQNHLYALPVKEDEEYKDFKVDDSFNIARVPVSEAFKSGGLNLTVSTYDANDQMIRDTWAGPGRKLVTFTNILRNGVFPLAEIVDFMLTEGAQEMALPVEIEFAGDINENALSSKEKGTLYWLQIRPIVDRKEMLDDSILDVADEELILRSDTALGHGLMEGVKKIVYVKPKRLDNTETRAMAEEIGRINKELVEKNEPYILIGPGRWGSSDPALGIPVTWPQIAGARLITEAAIPGFRVEPSQGTHFFQNLTSFGVGYFTVDQPGGHGYYDTAYLDSLPAEYESDWIRIVSFDEPLQIAINGKKRYGIVRKPTTNS